jgi:hypothetical protein
MIGYLNMLQEIVQQIVVSHLNMKNVLVENSFKNTGWCSKIEAKRNFILLLFFIEFRITKISSTMSLLLMKLWFLILLTDQSTVITRNLLTHQRPQNVHMFKLKDKKRRKCWSFLYSQGIFLSHVCDFFYFASLVTFGFVLLCIINIWKLSVMSLTILNYLT